MANHKFFVDGKEKEGSCYVASMPEIGDTIKVYYYHGNGENYYITTYHLDNRFEYTICFGIGILIILFRFKNKIFIKNKIKYDV